MSLEQSIAELNTNIVNLIAAIGTIGSLPATAAAPQEKVKADKSKAEAKKEEAKAVEQPAPTPDPAKTVEQPAPATKTDAPAANAPTYEDVRAAMLELNTAKGRDATLDVLAKMGVQTVPALKDYPEKFAEVIALANAAKAA